MQGRGFLTVAQDLALGPTEGHWRAGAVQAYYALFLECRDTLARWGRRPTSRDNVHAFVRLQLTYASDQDLKRIASELDFLVRLRNQASYQLTGIATFATRVPALDAYRRATAALALLDAIVADPARLAAAVASLPPPPP